MTQIDYPTQKQLRVLALSSAKVIGVIANRLIHSVALYLQLPSGSASDLADDALRVAHTEILNCAQVLQLARRNEEIVNALGGNLDPKPALDLLRQVQDSLILLSSRECMYSDEAAPKEEIYRQFQARPVAQYLSAVVRGGDAVS